MRLFLRTKRVEWGGKEVRLSSLECLFLVPLIEAKGKVVKGSEIGAFIFPNSSPCNYTRMVNIYAKRINSKVPGMLGAKKGAGYYLNTECIGN